MAFEYSSFVSYRRFETDIDYFKKINKIIESEGFYATNKKSSFFDIDSIKQGTHFDDKIYDSVKMCYFFVPILIPHYLNKDNLWCAREMMFALKIEEKIKEILTKEDQKKFFFIHPFTFRGNAAVLPNAIKTVKFYSLADLEYTIKDNLQSPALVKFQQEFSDNLTNNFNILDKYSDIDFQTIFDELEFPNDNEVIDWIKKQKLPDEEYKNLIRNPPLFNKSIE